MYNEAYLDGKIRIVEEWCLIGEVFGEKIEGFEREIKAVTHHGLTIGKTKNGWEAVVLLDV